MAASKAVCVSNDAQCLVSCEAGLTDQIEANKQSSSFPSNRGPLLLLSGQRRACMAGFFDGNVWLEVSGLGTVVARWERTVSLGRGVDHSSFLRSGGRESVRREEADTKKGAVTSCRGWR